MPFKLFKTKVWGLRRKTTGFRFYQQIIILVLVIVMIPLGGLSIWLYDINDSALRKQIANTEEDVLRATLKATWQEARLRQEQAAFLQRAFIAQNQPSTTDTVLSKKTLARWVHQESTLSFLGLCEAQTPNRRSRLLQWASRSTPPQSMASHLSEWACQGNASSIPQHELIVSWNENALEPRWMKSRLPLNEALDVVQVRPLESLHSLLGDLLHLQKAGVWLVMPQAGRAKPHTLEVREKRDGTLDFQIGRLPKGVETPITPSSESLNPKKRTQDEGLVWQRFKLDGKDYIVSELKPLSVWLIVSPDWHENRHFIKQARLQTFFLIGLSLLLSILIGTAYVWGIIRNFRQMIKGIKAMGEGNYGRQIRLIVNWVTPFEIRYLTSEVNRMSRQLEKQVTTIQKVNKELAKLDELKSNLIDTVSHELRTPLMNIQGYTNRLLTHHPNLSSDQQVQALQTIKQQCKRLNRLVEDLLVIPDLENHQLRVYCEPHVIDDLWQGLLPLLSEQVQTALILEAESSLEDITIAVEEDRWQQVLINLLENAAKYRQGDEDAITVRFSRTATHAVIDVSNPSERITPEDLAKLFDKFHRLDDGLTRRSRGSGLGLFIAKALTEAMEGDLNLFFENDTFTARLSFPVLS